MNHRPSWDTPSSLKMNDELKLFSHLSSYIIVVPDYHYYHMHELCCITKTIYCSCSVKRSLYGIITQECNESMV